jgi:hypothetical protein
MECGGDLYHMTNQGGAALIFINETLCLEQQQDHCQAYTELTPKAV